VKCIKKLLPVAAVFLSALSVLGQTTTGTNSTATPIVVAVPQAIVSTPAGNQTVTQPGSTALSVNNLTVTGTLAYTGAFAGSITGNAATASQLLLTPTQCTGGQFSTGIAANGNANCSSTGTYLTNPMTALGDTMYGAAAGAVTRLPGNTTTTKKFYTETGDGTNSTAPAWGTLASTDIPNNAANTTGNAATATALQSTPTQCPAGQLATGIQSNGNANCSSTGGGGRTCNANGCYSVLGGGLIIEWGQVTTDINAGTVAVTFPYAFPTGCDSVSATTSGTSDRITFVVTGGAASPSCTTTGFTVGNNGSGAGATWTAFGH